MSDVILAYVVISYFFMVAFSSVMHTHDGNTMMAFVGFSFAPATMPMLFGVLTAKHIIRRIKLASNAKPDTRSGGDL